MRVGFITRSEELHQVAGEWQELADISGARAGAHPFWCLPWLRRLGRGSPLVVTARDGNTLVGLLPLQEQRLSGIRVARFIGHELGAIGEMALAPGYERVASEVWPALFRRRPLYLELGHYRSEAPGLEALRATSPPTRVDDADMCPILRTPESFERYMAERPKGFRRNLRRAEARLAQQGLDHAVELVTTADRAGAVFDELVAVCRAAETHRPRQNLVAGRWAPFTIDLMRTAAGAGRLRLFVGRIDGTPVSVDLALVTGGRIELWLGRFVPEWSRFSPGHMSIRAAVAHAVASGLSEVDFGLGYDEYKAWWAPDVYRTVTVSSASSQAGAWCGRAVLRARRAAWRWEKIVKKRVESWRTR